VARASNARATPIARPQRRASVWPMPAPVVRQPQPRRAPRGRRPSQSARPSEL
jgi:hypothetical protein